MKPIQLLAVTESVVETKETLGRYRLPKRNPLPRFGSSKNPFASSPHVDLAPPAGMPPPAPPTPPEPRATTPEAPAPTEARVVAPVHPWRRWNGSARLRNLVSILQNAASAVGRAPQRWWTRKAILPARKRSPALPVQGELSLDKVKVVRNDLHDSDVEVVPLRPKPFRKEASSAGNAPVPAGGVKQWTRWTARFLRAAQNQVH